MTPDAIKAALSTAICETAVQPRDDERFSRSRKLTMDTVLHLLIGAEGGSLAKELHSAGVDATPAALSQRRAQIVPDMFRDVFLRFNSVCGDSETFRGYRILAVDGTSVNMPRNPNAPSFVCNDSAPNGYNQLHLNPLYDVCNKIYFDVVVEPKPQKDENGALIEMLRRNEFERPTLIVADRGYESYNLIAHLLEKEQTDFVIRVKQNHSAMREIARLPMLELDCDIAFTITTTQTNEDKLRRHIYLQVPQKSKEGSKTRRGRWDFPSPYPIHLRIVRFQLETGEFETIATSLPRSFTLEDIRELYHLRWGIETSFRDLKYSLGLVNLHGKSDAFVEQEMYAALTAFNFTSRIVREAVVHQPKDGVYAYRVNFKMAVGLCREFFRTSNVDGEELIQQIAKYAVPVRPGHRDNRNLRAKGFVGFTYRVAA
ncbi:IS4 family transposase IS1675 [bioreactor metagenome]|uniref:IS4 family transposase IS1675 n=1 Tax=bioreactor metagenome TaxID=1076179 RepID=A0A644XQP7_9ZZZZ